MIFLLLAGILCSANPQADSLIELQGMKIVKIPAARESFLRYCAFCHGNEGRGDGLNAFSIKTPPRNFTDTTAMKGRTPPSIRNVIRFGGAANKLSPDMPSWGRTLDSMTIDRLSDYIETLD